MDGQAACGESVAERSGDADGYHTDGWGLCAGNYRTFPRGVAGRCLRAQSESQRRSAQNSSASLNFVPLSNLRIARTAFVPPPLASRVRTANARSSALLAAAASGGAGREGGKMDPSELLGVCGCRGMAVESAAGTHARAKEAAGENPRWI